jgi:hypothetical protein
VSPSSIEVIDGPRTTLFRVLAEAEIPLRLGASAYVLDEYFDASESERNRTVVDLDFTRINFRQESVVIKHIADDLSLTEWDALDVLVPDGGEVSPKEIMEEADRYPGSVCRALKRNFQTR